MKNTNTNPEFKIEKGVPIPPAQGCRRYFFEQLKPTESVFVPGVRLGNVGYALQRARLILGGDASFTARTENGGVRVWRVK